MRYNLALVPVSVEATTYFTDMARDYAVATCSTTKYMLGERSHPHISLFQFELDLAEPAASTLSNLWDIAQACFARLSEDTRSHGLVCVFDNLVQSKHESHGFFSGTTWFELALNKALNQGLVEYHLDILNTFKDAGIDCKNKHGMAYYPHLTLFNSNSAFMLKERNGKQINPPIPQRLRFVPVLGAANSQWELINILRRFEVTSNIIKQEKFLNLNIINERCYREAIQKLPKKKAHVTNGAYAYDAAIIESSTVAGFEKVLSLWDGPLVIAVNSDTSMLKLGKSGFEHQLTRAIKVARILCQHFSKIQIYIVFFDEKTPSVLYEEMSRAGIAGSLHKWGYAINPGDPRIEGAEYFEQVYAFPLPDGERPYCYQETEAAMSAQSVQVVNLNEKSLKM